MKVVLDSSMAFKWLVPEDGTEKAIQLRDEFQSQVHELLAPEVFPVEVSHALTRAGRQGRVAISDTYQLMAEFLKILPELRPMLPLLPRAFEISSDLRIGIYDCLYLALGEFEQCPVVTADTKFFNNVKSTFPFVVDLNSFLPTP